MYNPCVLLTNCAGVWEKKRDYQDGFKWSCVDISLHPITTLVLWFCSMFNGTTLSLSHYQTHLAPLGLCAVLWKYSSHIYNNDCSFACVCLCKRAKYIKLPVKRIFNIVIQPLLICSRSHHNCECNQDSPTPFLTLLVLLVSHSKSLVLHSFVSPEAHIVSCVHHLWWGTTDIRDHHALSEEPETENNKQQKQKSYNWR